MNDQQRNEKVSRLDQIWQVRPRPLGRLKDLANSLTRWYVQGVVDQQNQVNAAVTQALQALAANDDRRHNELLNHINLLNNQLNLTRQQVASLARRVERLESGAEGPGGAGERGSEGAGDQERSFSADRSSSAPGGGRQVANRAQPRHPPPATTTGEGFATTDTPPKEAHHLPPLPPTPPPSRSSCSPGTGWTTRRSAWRACAS